MIDARKYLVGYDGCSREEVSKVHAAVSKESLPLSIVAGSGGERDSKKFTEVMGV